MNCQPCFNFGDKVTHAANGGGLFPSGCGTVVNIVPWNSGDGYSYQVQCDKTKQLLPVNFKDTELTAAP